MRRFLVAAAAVTCVATVPLFAKSTQAQLRSRWLGAWVVLTSEVSSDCSGMHTNNRVNGALILGGGAHGFEPGEVGKVTAIDLKRSRIDVFVDLREDILVSHQDGPFELYREAPCRVELLVEVPRSMVKGGDIEGIDRRILKVAERHVSQAEALESPLWNQRERQPYPADYDRTLAEYAAWKARIRNETISLRITDAMENARIVLARVSVERPGYSEAFTHGLEVMSGRRFDDCGRMLASSYDSWKQKPPEGYHGEGYYDGQLLAYSVQIASNLQACYVPVPPLPEGAQIASAQP